MGSIYGHSIAAVSMTSPYGDVRATPRSESSAVR